MVSSKITPGECISSGGDILSNDVITKINDVNVYGFPLIVQFSSQDSGFTVKDLKVVLVKSGGEAEGNDIIPGMVVSEFDGTHVQGDLQLSAFIREKAAQNLSYEITFIQL